MADLREKDSAQSVKIVGSNQSGVEDYYATVTSEGYLKTESSLSDPGGLWDKYCANGQSFSLATGIFYLANAGTEYDVLAMSNPTASSHNVRLYKAEQMFLPGLSLKDQTLRIYRDPTYTGGTSVTINKLRKSSTYTSVVSAVYSPTVTARGTLLYIYDCVQAYGTIPFNLAQYIEEGEKMLFTITTTISNKEHNIQAIWAEEAS